MFDVAPTELLLVAAVALVVIGPKDLPNAMRVVGRWVAKAQGVARHFRSGLDEMVRQAELEEMEKKWAEENARIMREHPLADPPPATTTQPEMRPLAHGEAAVATLPVDSAPAHDDPAPVQVAVIPFPADPAFAEATSIEPLPELPPTPAEEPLLPFEPERPTVSRS